MSVRRPRAPPGWFPCTVAAVESKSRSIRLRYDTEENVGTSAARCRRVLRLICGAFGGLRIGGRRATWRWNELMGPSTMRGLGVLDTVAAKPVPRRGAQRRERASKRRKFMPKTACTPISAQPAQIVTCIVSWYPRSLELQLANHAALGTEAARAPRRAARCRGSGRDSRGAQTVRPRTGWVLLGPPASHLRGGPSTVYR